MTNIELIARGIIVKDGNILLCKNLSRGHYFLPGGHIEQGESEDQAFRREIQEEIGREVKEIKRMEEIENSYVEDVIEMNEFLSIYLVKLENYDDIKSLEDHISFDWIPLKDLATCGYKPEGTVEEVLRIVKENKGFWV